jgi:hypothetical protein
MEPQKLFLQWPSRGMVMQKNGKYGLIDLDLQIITPPVYDEITDRDEELVMVRKGKKHGVMDRHGSLMAPVQFDEAYYVAPFIICYNRWDRFMQAAYYKNGKAAAPLKHQKLYSFGKTLVRGIGRSWQLLDTAGRKVRTLPYDEVMEDSGYLIVKKNGKYGIIDSAENIMVPIKYQMADDNRYRITNGLVEIKRGGKIYTLDLYGHELLGQYPEQTGMYNE